VTPNSRLTIARPDIWERGLVLATALTGYQYLPKLPLADGTIFACGYWPTLPTPAPKTPAQEKQDRIDKIDSEIQWRERLIRERKEDIGTFTKQIEELRKEKATLTAAPFVLVPEGEMEWLLHEVGHWLASSPEERAMPNYGDGHELEAWAFEQMVLGPIVGRDARTVAPPTQRDGTAFDYAGPLPGWAFGHIDRCVCADRVDVEAFRALWSEWIAWGAAQGNQAPWSSESGRC
jgi:hypothetical protein